MLFLYYFVICYFSQEQSDLYEYKWNNEIVLLQLKSFLFLRMIRISYQGIVLIKDEMHIENYIHVFLKSKYLLYVGNLEY